MWPHKRPGLGGTFEKHLTQKQRCGALSPPKTAAILACPSSRIAALYRAHAMVASEEPTLTVVVWRKLCAILKAWRSAGDIPGMLVVFIPRLTVSYMVVTVAQMARAIARLVGTSSSYEPKANLRILIITDYMPPQTHG